MSISMIMLFCVIAFIVTGVGVGVAVFLACHLKNEKYKKFVEENSIGLRQLREINGRYHFNPFVSFNQTYTYDNKDYFDTVSCTDYLIYQLQFFRKGICEQINKMDINKWRYADYLKEANAVQCGNFQEPIERLNPDKLIKIEKRLLEKEKLPTPCTQFSLTVTLYRSDLNGNVFGGRRKAFSASEILALLKRLDNKRGTFYNDREIWDALCRVERGKVSNQLRLEIYKRDGNRCRYCGAPRSDSNPLEIDHIVPISKGGKSTYENLQTLCHRCNVEKGSNLYKY